jgi:hypothetical protein
MNNKINKNPLNLDLVFEGGLFNGSYQMGFLTYVKELEKRNYVKIHRLSGCSVGSLIALSFFIDETLFENCIQKISNIIYRHLKKNYNVNFFNKLFSYLHENLPCNILDLIKGKLFISYYDIKTGKQYVKNNYKTIEELFDTIRRSCSFPFLIDNNVLYKERYIDGIYPYIFKPKKNRKIINLNIINVEKIYDFISIKNEKTNIRRIFEGIIDSHMFFTTNFKCNMCSFVNEWTILEKIKYFIIIKILSIIPFILNKLYIVNEIIKSSTDDKININKLIKNIYITLVRTYCV